MKPFSFFPTASGASKTQPMSSSEITRINRIRAASVAYPNILGNPPKNISNLALGGSEISAIRLGNTINNGIFSYNPKPQPVVSEGGSQPDYGQPLNSARIVNGHFRVVFSYSNPFTDFTFLYNRNGSSLLTTDYTVIDNLTVLNTGVYLAEDDGIKINTGITPLSGDEILFSIYGTYDTLNFFIP